MSTLFLLSALIRGQSSQLGNCLGSGAWNIPINDPETTDQKSKGWFRHRCEKILLESSLWKQDAFGPCQHYGEEPRAVGHHLQESPPCHSCLRSHKYSKLSWLLHPPLHSLSAPPASLLLCVFLACPFIFSCFGYCLNPFTKKRKDSGWRESLVPKDKQHSMPSVSHVIRPSRCCKNKQETSPSLPLGWVNRECRLKTLLKGFWLIHPWAIKLTPVSHNIEIRPEIDNTFG